VNPLVEPAHDPCPLWAAEARRVRIARAVAGVSFDAILADDGARRRAGWAHARVAPATADGRDSGAARTPMDTSASGLPAVFFSFDLERHHGFWMQDVAVDLDLVFLARDGRVLGVHRMAAGTSELVHPPEPIRYALQLGAGDAAAHGIAVGSRLAFDPDEVAPVLPQHPPEDPIEPDPRDEPALIERWCAREHLYSSRHFAAGASEMGWRLRVGPDDVAIWVHAGGGFVIHPPLCPLRPLAELTRSLGLAWLRLELAPHARLRLPDGAIVDVSFDPRRPDEWLGRMRELGFLPTVGRWQQTRTLVVELGGDEDALMARLPTRIRYEAKAFQRALDDGRYRVEAVPAAAFDARQARAVAKLHAGWLANHPGASDNLVFCDPLARAYRDALTAWLCWRGAELVAVQYHVLWERTLFFLFSEAAAPTPQGLTPGLLYHGIAHAKRAPFGPSPAPDLLDLLGAFDQRYPEFRMFGKGYTGSKLRWHPTSVWFPPSVALPGTELPP
jgi:uncharacterized membrane protein (UPF0127 family)